jgi:hypothetical protein
VGWEAASLGGSKNPSKIFERFFCLKVLQDTRWNVMEVGKY